MKRLFSFLLAFSTFVSLFTYGVTPSAQAAESESTKWSVLWLIIPEIDAVIDGKTYKSGLNSADAKAFKELANSFEATVEDGVYALNKLALDIEVTAVVSDIPLRKITGGDTGDRYPLREDLADILSKYAPGHECDYDSLIVTSKFSDVPRKYGAVNMGWYSFCPANTATDIDYYGINLQLHEWIHHMESVGNDILERAGSENAMPSPDGLQSGNYLDMYLSGKYSGVQGESYLTKFYLELLAGTLPESGKITSGFATEYWNARPTQSAPTVTITYEDEDHLEPTVEITYTYPVEINGESPYVFALGWDGGFKWVMRDAIEVSNDSKTLTIDLTTVNGGSLTKGRNYHLDSQGRVQAKDTGLRIRNPSFRFEFTTGGSADPAYIDGTISLTDDGTTHINLAKETVKVPFTIAAYSTDGGKKWKKGSLPTDQAKLSKLFDRGMELWVASKYNDRDIKEGNTVTAKKGVANDATVVMFPKIEKRPKANSEKLGAFYSDENPKNWVLSKKGATTYTAPEVTYQWAATTDGKTASGAWQSIPEDGWGLKQPGEKVTYLFRSAAEANAETEEYTPASKVFKVKPASFQKAPNYKAPGTKNGAAALKLKKGDFCIVNDKIYGSLTAVTTLNIVYEIKDAETEILSGSKVTVWKGATGKKPRSVTQKDLTMPTITAPED